MIENEQEVIDYLKKEENKDFLSKNGFSKVETKVETKEVKTPLTEDEVKAFVEGNKELKSKLSEEMVKGYLKEKLGIDVNDDTLKQGLVLGGTVENIKKLAVGKILSGVKYGDLLMSKIDFTKIDFKDDKIEGIKQAENLGCHVFHAGTTLKDDGFYTSGGRVLNVVACGSTLEESRKKAYEGVSKIYWEGMQYRSDIAMKGIARLKNRKKNC